MTDDTSVKLCAAKLRHIEDMAFHFADDVHFTRLAIKLQGEHFITMNQLHIADFSAHTGHAFGLFWTQVKRET